MDYLEVIRCNECGMVNHLDRFADEECFKCGAELELPRRRNVGRGIHKNR